MKPGVTQLVVPREWSTPQFIKESAAAGYECVELALRNTGDLTPDVSDDVLKEIRAAADEHHIELASMVHGQCTGSLLAGGAAAETSLNETRRGLEIAAALSIGCTLHTLGRQSAEIYYDDAFDFAVANLKSLAADCRKYRTMIAIEFVWNGFLFSPREMRQFLDAVGESEIGFYFDPGNMAVYQFPHHWVRATASHIKMVHLKDWTGGPLNGSWPRLLTGGIDYRTMNAELRSAGYDGPMISEVDLSAATLSETCEDIRKVIAL